MVWVVIVVLGGLMIGFAYAAGEWKKRAEFWEHAYLEKAGNLEALLTGVEEYIEAEDEGVLRVWAK